MPRRTPPEKLDPIHGSLALTDVFEESESLGKIQQWLERADPAPKPAPTNKKRTA